mgnify:CR=1 FL=1
MQELAVKSVAEATHYAAVFGSVVTQIKCEWTSRNGRGDVNLLKVNAALQTLDLPYCELYETGGQAIAEASKVSSAEIFL